MKFSTVRVEVLLACLSGTPSVHAQINQAPVETVGYAFPVLLVFGNGGKIGDSEMFNGVMQKQYIEEKCGTTKSEVIRVFQKSQLWIAQKSK